MNNMVENINIEEIIPIKNEKDFNQEEINNLMESINNYGIIEPIIVRKENNKYEILAGKKRYQAAKLLGLNEVPVLIKNIDTNFYNTPKEPIHQSKGNKFINPLPESEKIQRKKQNVKKDITSNSINNNIGQDYITFNMSQLERNKNNDIVNLTELNKEEYERDDLKMNNEMLNNQMVQPENNNMIQEPQTPSFGGRFFPSLEDEPTNMNMGGMNFVGEQPTNPIPTSPVSSTPQNANLIDLTDINNEAEASTPQNNSLPTAQQITQTAEATINNTNVDMVTPTLEPQTQLEPTAPMMNPMSNNLPQNELVENGINNQPVMQPQMMASTPQMDTSYPQQDMSIPQMSNEIQEPIPSQPQFDMSQSMAPVEPLQNQVQYNTEVNNLPQSNMMPNMQEPAPISNEFEQPIQQINQQIPNQEQPVIETPSFDTMQVPGQEQNSKDITPVTNTLKNLIASLQELGYNINVSEEQLESSIKLTIEIKQ